MGFRMLRTAAALVTVLLLAGCVPREPVITPEPDPASTPVFASDDEALAAATEAYARYLEVSDQILADGGASPDRLKTVSTLEWFEKQVPGFEDARDRGLRSVGSTTFDTVSLQQYDSKSVDGIGIVRIYLCIDVSAVDVVDASGNSVVSDTRPDRSAVEVSFDTSEEGASIVLVASVDQWSGQDFCG